ncbi:MAG TPA: class I SAM-dependent methyltransferase [Anaerolineae bacterium]|nr:class I SAM-dependent methyltransferase [Anaerolineae bacterium]HQK15273.1 class I SAM-dependent methyltransferase [Anaerolineae bacterium]
MIKHQIENALKGFHADRILDIGPGFSTYSRLVSELTGATDVTYLDVSQEVLDYQAEEAKKAGLRAECLRVNLDSEGLLSIPTSFDIILCQEVLEHLHNVDEVLAALAKLLTPKGRIIITVPTKISERWLKFLNPAYMKNEAYGHVQEFDTKKLKQTLDKAGLHPIVFLHNQPHYFICQSWLMISRMEVDGSRGVVVTNDWRRVIFTKLCAYSLKFFLLTNYQFWARIFPRNYFVIAALK